MTGARGYKAQTVQSTTFNLVNWEKCLEQKNAEQIAKLAKATTIFNVRSGYH